MHNFIALKPFIMKQLILSLVLFTSITATAQSDFEKVRAEYEKVLNNHKSYYGHNKKTGKFYNIRGFKMYAEVYGQGQPLLFIHGNGGSINNFVYQIPFFSKQYKVIIADSRAQGQSVDAGDSLTYEMMADDYAALLDSLKVDSAYVTGWSDGGINGLLLAMRHPKKVKKLAITGANLRPDTTAVYQEVWDLVLPNMQMLKSKQNMTKEEKNGMKLLKLLAEQPNISLASLQQIKCPVLVMGGDHDVIKPEHTLEIFNNIPHAYLWMFPNSGHSTPVVYANEFNKKTLEFFKMPYRKFDAVGRFF